MDKTERHRHIIIKFTTSKFTIKEITKMKHNTGKKRSQQWMEIQIYTEMQKNQTKFL